MSVEMGDTSCVPPGRVVCSLVYLGLKPQATDLRRSAAFGESRRDMGP